LAETKLLKTLTSHHAIIHHNDAPCALKGQASQGILIRNQRISGAPLEILAAKSLPLRLRVIL
jgi:hypothetical protein